MIYVLRKSVAFLAISMVLSFCFPTFAAPPKGEDELIGQLTSRDAGKVTEALQKLEKEYPTSTKALPEIKKLLKDDRAKVRRKAARVLGVLHAEMSSENIKDISSLLKSTDRDEVIDGLKSLRGLKAEKAVPDILPLLKHTDPNIKRDACRTLAIVGSKSDVPSIEPLLNDSKPDVRKDAQDAIDALKNK